MSLLLRTYRFPFDTVRREMADIFGREWPLDEWLAPERTYPPVNVYESPDAVIVEFEMPGVRTEDTDLTITAGSVTLKVSRPVEGDIAPEKYYVRERYRGQFGRTVTVPGTVDSSKAAASYRNGVLSVRIPKAEEAKPRRIAVEAGKDSQRHEAGNVEIKTRGRGEKKEGR